MRLNADGIKEVVFLELFSGKSISRKPDVAELIPIKKISVALQMKGFDRTKTIT